MQALLFYLTYPLIYIIASLPFGILYKISDFLFYIIKLTGYRKEVVLKNLRNSFPEKSPEEITAIYHAYFHYFCDLIVEATKTIKMTEKDARKHCTFNNTEWLDKLYQENKSILIVMGHYGNWEWAGPSFSLNSKFQLVVIYRPLANIYFERMASRMRTKFGTQIVPINQTLRAMVANRKKVTATALIADQTASPENAYWTTFLNQDTAVYTG